MSHDQIANAAPRHRGQSPGQGPRPAKSPVSMRADDTIWRAAFERNPLGAAVVGGDGRLCHVNERFCSMLGRAGEELIGRSLLDFTHPDDAAGDGEWLRRLTAEGASESRAEKRWVHRDGSLSWASVTASHLGREGGEPRILLMAEDVVEQRRADAALGESEEAPHESRRTETELRQLNEDLERRVGERTRELETLNKELESFSYSVSHDLRAPLRAIQGFSEALAEDCADRLGEDGLGYLSRIRAAAERMGHLIGALLKLSHLMRATPQRRPVNLSTLAWSVANDLQGRHAARQVEVVIPEDLVAEADGDLMRTALENLLENAWKYTGQHERARVEFGVAGERAGARVYVVRDDGAGFDMAHAGKLFTPFQRLHAPSEFAGDGIGLATVARIIRRHGGEIWAEAAPEQGASFFFTLGESRPPADV